MNIETAKPSETYEGLRRQFMALRTLAASTEQIASGLRRELKDQTQSLADLAAERATNEQLTATLLATEAERDRLKAENEALRKDAELLALGRAKLGGAMSRLRAKHNDWTAPEALPAAELVWCACGDGFPPNSYGAGFMDANNGVCWSCDAAKAVSHD
ncbi:MAG TPA: hypothetical protein DCP84_16715 [Pseudomonas sp.]|nr:hypothetical protein [Pseudomonas sp.]